MAQFLYVISRDRRDAFERLKEDFAGQHDVAVILDRRRNERRTVMLSSRVNLRRADRRRQRELDRELRTVGSFITECADAVVLIVL